MKRSRLGLTALFLSSLAGIGGVAVIGAANSGARGSQGLPKPVTAVAAVTPRGVPAALGRTASAKRVVVLEHGQTGAMRYVIDTARGRAEVWSGNAVSSIQVRREVYAPAGKRSCYLSARRSSGLLPNVAGMLLPTGVTGMTYSMKGNTIHWAIPVANGYSPHGWVKVGRGGRIVAADIFSGPGKPLVVTVSYPRSVAKIVAPSKLCK